MTTTNHDALEDYERGDDIDMRGGDCWGCEERLGYRRHHNVVFSDSRTMRNFCHECVVALATWELDSYLDRGGVDLSGWVADE